MFKDFIKKFVKVKISKLQKTVRWEIVKS